MGGFPGTSYQCIVRWRECSPGSVPVSHCLFQSPSNKIYLRAASFVSMVHALLCSLCDVERQEAAACPSPLCPPHAAVVSGPEHVTMGPG